MSNFAKESRSEAQVSKGELSILIGESVIVGGYGLFDDLAKEFDWELREGGFRERRANRGGRG